MLTDEEIRLKAAEISFNICAALSAAVIQNAGLGNLTEFAPFGQVKEIEEYVRNGKIPEPIKAIKREIT